jgi:large subunit ribosomal protein L23
MWMPTMPMILINATNATDGRAAKAMFRVWPRMTKHEVKEYLTKIYQLPVEKVRTMNYHGKRMRAMGKRKIVYYKYRNFKKAVVTFDSSVLDLGMGVRIPELEDDQAEEMEAGK